MSNKNRCTILLTTVLYFKNCYIQLGLYNLQSYLLKNLPDKKQIKIRIFTFRTKKKYFRQEEEFPYLSQREINSIVKKIIKKKPGIIGFSCFLWNLGVILKLAKLIKRLAPEILIILGGPEATDNSEEILRHHPYIDIVVRGEGERTFYEIIDSFLYKNSNFSLIKGISYRTGNSLAVNPDRQLMDLQVIPSPYINGFINIKTKNRLVVETARGCPFNCVYCSFHVMGYNRVRYFPLNRVKRELILILINNPKFLWINDDNFNLDQNRAKILLKTVNKYRKNTKVSVFLNASLRFFDKELVYLMSESEITGLIGIQSVNQQTLKLVNRLNNQEILHQNLKFLDQADIRYILQFIIGLPNDTYNDIKNSLNWAMSYGPYEISFFPLMVLKGTALANNAEKYGISYNHQTPYISFKTGTLSSDDFQRSLQLSKTVNLLYNKGLLRNTISYLHHEYDLEYSHIFESWGISNKLVLPYKNYLRGLQKNIIQYLSKVDRLDLDIGIVNDLMKNDLNSYIANKSIFN